MCNLPPLNWLVKGLKKLSIVTDVAYCSYNVEPDLSLTNTYQVVTGWNELITPQNISLDSGVFTATKSGVYEWDLERVYTNEENNSSGIVLYLRVIKNGTDEVFMGEAPIPDAANSSKPILVGLTSPFIIAVEANDTFQFEVKATDGGTDSPAIDTVKLTRMQLKANKIHELQ